MVVLASLLINYRLFVSSMVHKNNLPIGSARQNKKIFFIRIFRKFVKSDDSSSSQQFFSHQKLRCDTLLITIIEVILIIIIQIIHFFSIFLLLLLLLFVFINLNFFRKDTFCFLLVLLFYLLLSLNFQIINFLILIFFFFFQLLIHDCDILLTILIRMGNIIIPFPHLTS